jgi:hypothetical protein
MASLYETLVSAGCKIDSHESDLYVEATPTAEKIITEFIGAGLVSGATHFTSAIDGKRWADIPFAFEPFWKARGMT